MFKQNKSQTEIEKQQDHNNLVGFFDLLLKIDKRENPERYETSKQEKQSDD